MAEHSHPEYVEGMAGMTGETVKVPIRIVGCPGCIEDEFKRYMGQPDPEPNESRPIWELVIEDMQVRDHVGRQRYGTPLQARNGRDALRDAYEEALDLVVYLRQAIEERGG